MLGMRAVLWSPDSSDNTLLASTYDFERWGLSERCLGCRYLRTGQGRQKAHSLSCRRRIEALLGGDPSGSARLTVADERIDHALADAIKRQATKDLGTTGILTRASVVCHPRATPSSGDCTVTAHSSHLRVSIRVGRATQRHHKHGHGRHDEREEGMGRTQDVAGTSGNDDLGDDVAMRDDNAAEDRFSDFRRRITMKRRPREHKDERTSTTEQLVPRRISTKTTPPEHTVAVTTRSAERTS